ncbi:hypothetical protein Ahy_B01g055931 [Arachis hypogaea]|uniref:phosphoribosylaminoimidazolesuccinocarboxamide synthase n=1 Tax=Arachis hypogaea TaxID=3818 RepID=A0A445AXI6_ARAHY|nr:hypothetical protein Ahy_B01g055931 [Arachis hypogaea]
MAAALNPPKTPPSNSTSHPLFRLPQPPPHSLSNQTTTSPHSPPPYNHKNTPLYLTLFSTAHARIKCSNPLEPPPPSTASPKQNFTIQFQSLPPKPGKRCLTRQACVGYIVIQHITSLVKNQKLVENIFTPTTKVADHDVPVLPDEIIERGLMTRADYEEVSRKALSLLNTVRVHFRI